MFFLVACGSSTDIAPVYREGSNAQRNAHLNPSKKASEPIKGKITKKRAQRIVRSSQFDGLDPLEQHRIAKAAVDPNNHRTNKRFLTDAPAYVRPAPVKEARIASNGVPIPEAKPRGTSPSITQASAVTPPLKPRAVAPASRATSAPIPAPPPRVKRGASSPKPPTHKTVSFHNSVTQIRFGGQGGASRVVLDMQAMTSYNVSLDPNKRFVRVALNNTGWSAPVRAHYNNHPLIKSYSALPNATGTALVLELTKPARLLSHKALPRSGASGDRIYFDIAPL